jgi:hypothetical protein
MGFSFITLALFALAFLMPTISCDRWQLLNLAWPIFAGIAGTCFVGDMTIRQRIAGFEVFAVGGFAVFFVYLMHNQLPARCITSHVQIAGLKTWNPECLKGDRNERYLSSLCKKDDWIFKLEGDEDPKAFALPIGFVVHDFYRWEDGTVNLAFRVTGYRPNGRSVAWTELVPFGTVGAWKETSIASHLKEGTLLKEFDIRDEETTIPVAFVVECRLKSEMENWIDKDGGKAKLEVVVEDLHSRTLAKLEHDLYFPAAVTWLESPPCTG